MLGALGLVALGLILLAGGGELLLRGAVALARLLRLTPAVIGLTVVAAGTSVPELSVSVVAAVEGRPDIAVGNVVGSNIFNIAFILGLCGLVKALVISGNSIRLEYPVLLIVTMMAVAVAQDGTVNWVDGTLFVTVYVLFTAYMVTLVRGQTTDTEKGELTGEVDDLAGAPRLGPALFGVGAGVALLGAGATVTVEGAVTLARFAGLTERVIGLTIVAAGTSLPEIVASLMSTLKGRDDVAIGNVIGSNLFNILGILGVSSLIHPLAVHPSIVASDNWWMLAITLLLFPLMFTQRRIERWEGGLLLAAYGLYTGLLLARP